MRRRVKKALAVLLTFLMVFGIIPTNFSNISVKAAEAPQADGDVSAFILDASKLSADDFGGFGTKIEENMTLGTNGFFTLYAQSKKNSLADLSSSPLEAPNGTYTQAINLGGQVKNTYDAALGFTVDRPATLKAYVAVKAVNATKHSFQMGKDGAKPATAFEMVNDTAVVNEIELDLEAGTYLIGGDNGGNFLC